MHKILLLKLPLKNYMTHLKGTDEIEAQGNNLLKVNRFTLLKKQAKTNGALLIIDLKEIH